MKYGVPPEWLLDGMNARVSFVTYKSGHKIMNIFYRLVMSAWGPLLTDFNLSICTIQDDKILVRGNGFVILVDYVPQDGAWYARYLDFDNISEWKVIDIMDYLQKKNIWLFYDTPRPKDIPWEEDMIDYLLLYVRNFREVAPYILEGKKDWLKDADCCSWNSIGPAKANAVFALLMKIADESADGPRA